MNLNKLLCKYLDREGKGYVTIGTVILASHGAACALATISMYILGAINSPNIGLLPTPSNSTVWEAICHAVFIGITAPLAFAIVAIILATLLEYATSAWSTKIATCERKDGDEQHES